MTRPAVSVVMPTFNRLQWLPEAVHTIQEQTFTDWELVIVDDGSTDNTRGWAQSIGDSRVRYLARAHTGSIAATRNAGIDAAGGEWLAFLDSDDRWRPDKLERQLTRLAEAGHTWCYGKYQTIDERGVVVPQPAGAPWQPFEGLFVDRILTTDAAVLTQTLLMSAALARQLRFDERLPLAEDYDFVLRLAAIAPGLVVDEVLAEIRLHEGRTTSRSGPFDGYHGKVIAYRKAARTMPDRRLRRIARHQFHSHLGAFLRQALRRGSVGQMMRIAVALART